MRSLPFLPVALLLSTLAPCHGAASAAKKADEPHGKLEDKGLSGAMVLAGKKPFKGLRLRPPVSFPAQGPAADREGTATSQHVEFTLSERAGEARPGSHVSFGFPFAPGALFDLNKIRLLASGSEKELPLQTHVLALWPDQSIKSALLVFQTDLQPKQTRGFAIEFGRDIIRNAESAERLHVEETGETIRVSTGLVEVLLGKDASRPFLEVYALQPQKHRVAESSGIEIEDEHGILYSSAFGRPENVRIERNGPGDALIRMEGKFTAKSGQTLMRYVARMRLSAGSSRADLSVTAINDELASEFTDISRFGLSILFPKADSWAASLQAGGEEIHSEKPVQIIQWDENQVLKTTDETSQATEGRAEGWAAVRNGGDRVQVALRDFWQRWPKGLSTRPGEISIGFLPRQQKGFGEALPDHLRYPFVAGRYRLKWGMAFTERMSLDFVASRPERLLWAEVNSPATAVLPAAYLASTGAFGKLPGHSIAEAEGWNRYMDRSLQLHHQQRRENREYGYLNYGDWFGERGHNWGNNEYDRAHGFFSHFFQTGNTAFFDDALAAARHQADVDIVHAYPDPFYIGANPQHSMGHTGICYQKNIPHVWSHAYDHSISAGNGHTWADGMADCWLFTGDPVVMESLLMLGEHISSAFAPTFTALGTHERSAGWSILAALATYRATSDPAYLQAAERIVKLTLSQWDSTTGIWPHLLPPAHAGGRADVVGNSLYNIGVLVMALGEYHAIAPDTELLACIRRTCEWFVRTYRPDQAAWPYSADIHGQPPPRSLTPNLNPLIYPGLTYAALVTGNREWLQLARHALLGTFENTTSDALAKELSIKAYGTTAALGFLAEATEQGLLAPGDAITSQEPTASKDASPSP